MLWNEMAYTMQYGLTPTQVDLGHTHIGGHNDENETTRDACMRARKPRTEPTARNATLTRHGKDMEYDILAYKFQRQNEMQNSPETWQNGTRCMERVPKHEIRHTE